MSIFIVQGLLLSNFAQNTYPYTHVSIRFNDKSADNRDEKSISPKIEKRRNTEQFDFIAVAGTFMHKAMQTERILGIKSFTRLIQFELKRLIFAFILLIYYYLMSVCARHPCTVQGIRQTFANKTYTASLSSTWNSPRVYARCSSQNSKSDNTKCIGFCFVCRTIGSGSTHSTEKGIRQQIWLFLLFIRYVTLLHVRLCSEWTMNIQRNCYSKRNEHR